MSRCRAVTALALALSLGACGSSSRPAPSSPGSGAQASGGTHQRASRSSAGGPATVQPRHVAHLVLPAHPAPRTVHVPILTYHRVHLLATEFKRSIPDLTVEPSVFRAEIDALARGGYHTITQAQLYAALFRGAALPPRPVLISVDDGYVDDVKEILPVLRRHHMVATFYIISGRFREQGFVNETEVRRLDQAGMDIGAHSRTHVDLPALPPSRVRAEVAGSKRDLQRVLGHFVDFFAYPYGAESPAVVDEVRRAGFVLAVTTKGGTAQTAQAPLTLSRIHVGRAATPASVLGCIRSPTACGGGSG